MVFWNQRRTVEEIQADTDPADRMGPLDTNCTACGGYGRTSSDRDCGACRGTGAARR